VEHVDHLATLSENLPGEHRGDNVEEQAAHIAEIHRFGRHGSPRVSNGKSLKRTAGFFEGWITGRPSRAFFLLSERAHPLDVSVTKHPASIKETHLILLLDIASDSSVVYIYVNLKIVKQ